MKKDGCKPGQIRYHGVCIPNAKQFRRQVAIHFADQKESVPFNKIDWDLEYAWYKSLASSYRKKVSIKEFADDRAATQPLAELSFELSFLKKFINSPRFKKLDDRYKKYTQDRYKALKTEYFKEFKEKYT